MSDSLHQQSNLTVPSTQNTAPVLEFRCLYSHDLRRKSKRWQDGFLRFHTFNKRVMVYDVPRNFIGDTHWREGDSVQDGDELELEKGILIQVGEAVGSMHQDLTAILEKRKSGQEPFSSHTSLPRASSGYANTSAGVPLSQLRPKTLNAVLGMPRGAYGRAVLPNQSPYQVRYVDIPLEHENERLAKKQKLSTESLKKAGVLTESSAEAELPKRGLVTQSSRIPKTNQSLLRRSDQKRREIINLTSDDDSLSASGRPGKVAHTPTFSKRSEEESHHDHNSTKGCTLTIERGTGSNRSQIELECSDTSQVTHKATKLSRAQQRLMVGHERPTNPLRFASSKPRKKLMYKGLLPQRPPSKLSLGNHVTRRSSISESMAETTAAVSSDDGFGKSNELQRNRFGVEPRTSLDEANLWSKEQNELQRNNQFSDSKNLLDNGIIFPEDDSLFLTQSTIGDFTEEVQHEINISTRMESGENQDPPFLESTVELEASDVFALTEMDQLLLKHWQSNVPEKPQASSSSEIPPKMTILRKSGPEANPSDPPIKTTYFAMRNSIQTHVPAPLEQPLPAKAASNSSKSPNHHPPLPHQNPPRTRSPLKKSLSESDRFPRPPLPAVRPSKKPFQRAISDMTNIRNSSNNILARNIAPILEKKDTDLGPWSREAFDLFGWKVGNDKRMNGEKGG